MWSGVRLSAGRGDIDDDQGINLLSAYSMIPSAPSALSSGMISRTTFSSITVSTAIHPGIAREETVGRRNEGRRRSNSCNCCKNSKTFFHGELLKVGGYERRLIRLFGVVYTRFVCKNAPRLQPPEVSGQAWGSHLGPLSSTYCRIATLDLPLVIPLKGGDDEVQVS